MSKLSKLHIWMAISAIKSNTETIFFCKNIYYDVVVHVPNFQLSAKSTSFFCAFFLHFYGVLFLWTPYTKEEEDTLGDILVSSRHLPDQSFTSNHSHWASFRSMSVYDLQFRHIFLSFSCQLSWRFPIFESECPAIVIPRLWDVRIHEMK